MPQTFRVIAYNPPSSHQREAADSLLVTSDDRRVRRKSLQLRGGDYVLFDLPTTTTLQAGGTLLLDDGRVAVIEPGSELLYDVRARDATHLMELCWHLGNRHTPAEITGAPQGDSQRILIRRDHVLRGMLEQLGATVTEVTEPFSPVEGAYHSHGPAEPHALLNR